jgi:hypothetical protein
MKTMAALQCEQDRDLLTASLFIRWYKLRKIRPDLVPPILQRPGVPWVWTFTNPLDPWGSRERLPLSELECMVDQAELVMRRKDVAIESVGEPQQLGKADVA